MISIRPAICPGDLPTIRALFRVYAEGVGVDLEFQRFEEELAGLPGAYREPAGCLLLAEEDGAPAGCVAIRPFQPPSICELKRLYVSDPFRGRGVGRLLTLRALQESRDRGYARIRLDTLPHMGPAIALYRDLGFEEIAAYTHNPLPGALYFERTL
jgi:putative acetyltransferase